MSDENLDFIQKLSDPQQMRNHSINNIVQSSSIVISVPLQLEWKNLNISAQIKASKKPT